MQRIEQNILTSILDRDVEQIERNLLEVSSIITAIPLAQLLNDTEVVRGTYKRGITEFLNQLQRDGAAAYTFYLPQRSGIDRLSINVEGNRLSWSITYNSTEEAKSIFAENFNKNVEVIEVRKPQKEHTVFYRFLSWFKAHL